MLREPPGGVSDAAAADTRIRPGRGESRWSLEPDDADEAVRGGSGDTWSDGSWDEDPVALTGGEVAPFPSGGETAAAEGFPRPGRHAARRRRPVPGLGLLGPAQLTVVAVAVTLGLAVTSWWLVRSGSEPVPLAAQEAPALMTPAAVPGGAPSTAQPTSLVVDVAGKVRRPGITVLEPGARVVDAIEAAGGARRGVDLSSLNLARPLVDGEQILVGVRGGPPPAPAVDASGGGLLVNINTAGQTELESLPEVGPVTAQAIIAWREQHGAFTSVDQLVEVDGIGEATLATVSPFVTV